MSRWARGGASNARLRGGRWGVKDAAGGWPGHESNNWLRSSTTCPPRVLFPLSPPRPVFTGYEASRGPRAGSPVPRHKCACCTVRPPMAAGQGPTRFSLKCRPLSAAFAPCAKTDRAGAAGAIHCCSLRLFLVQWPHQARNNGRDMQEIMNGKHEKTMQGPRRSRKSKRSARTIDKRKQ